MVSEALENMPLWTQDEKLYKVVYVQPFSRVLTEEDIGFGAYIVGLRLMLENDRSFVLVNVPFEVAEAIKLINEGEAPPKRQSLFDLLANNEDFRKIFSDILKRVVIDELDYDTGLYTATVELEKNNFKLKLKMIPSHAIYLALVVEKPIYVAESLLDEEDTEIDF